MYCIAAAVQLDTAAPKRLGAVWKRCFGGVWERGGGVRRLFTTSAESDVSPESGNDLRFGMAPDLHKGKHKCWAALSQNGYGNRKETYEQVMGRPPYRAE
jgi:hypothetical protein